MTTLDRLLALHDEPFVRLAFEAVLRRPVDSGGLENYVEQLRRGVDRRHVLAELASSAEGRRANADIPGLRELVIAHAPRAWTWRKRVAGRIAAALVAPLETRLRSIDNQVHALRYRIEGIERRFEETQSLVIGLRHASGSVVARPEEHVAVDPRERLSVELGTAAGTADLSPSASRIAMRLAAALRHVRPII